MTTTRFPDGVNNVSPNNVLADLPIPDQGKGFLFLDDFTRYAAAEWVVGGVNAEVVALANGINGILSMATSAADNDNAYIQHGPATILPWSITAGKKSFFSARAQVDNATLCDMVFGFQVAVAADNFLTPTGGIFIRKLAGQTDFTLVSVQASIETVSGSLGAVVAGTPFEVSFYYDGKGRITAGLNGNVVVSITPSIIATGGTKITVGVQAGSAAVRTMLLDQLMCFKER